MNSQSELKIKLKQVSLNQQIFLSTKSSPKCLVFSYNKIGDFYYIYP